MILQETGLKDQFEYKALRLPLWGRAAETARGVPRGSAHWRGRGAAPPKPANFLLQKTKSRTKNRAKTGNSIRPSGWGTARADQPPSGFWLHSERPFPERFTAGNWEKRSSGWKSARADLKTLISARASVQRRFEGFGLKFWSLYKPRAAGFRGFQLLRGKRLTLKRKEEGRSCTMKMEIVLHQISAVLATMLG